MKNIASIGLPEVEGPKPFRKEMMNLQLPGVEDVNASGDSYCDTCESYWAAVMRRYELYSRDIAREKWKDLDASIKSMEGCVIPGFAKVLSYSRLQRREGDSPGLLSLGDVIGENIPVIWKVDESFGDMSGVGLLSFEENERWVRTCGQGGVRAWSERGVRANSQGQEIANKQEKESAGSKGRESAGYQGGVRTWSNGRESDRLAQDNYLRLQRGQTEQLDRVDKGKDSVSGRAGMLVILSRPVTGYFGEECYFASRARARNMADMQGGYLRSSNAIGWVHGGGRRGDEGRGREERDGEDMVVEAEDIEDKDVEVKDVEVKNFAVKNVEAPVVAFGIRDWGLFGCDLMTERIIIDLLGRMKREIRLTMR